MLILSNQLNKDEVTGGISDENGNFSIEVKPGMYNIKIDYLELRDTKNLKLTNKIRNAKIFIAYYVNKVRLIDNF